MTKICTVMVAVALGTFAAASVGQESAPPAQSPPAAQPPADTPAAPTAGGSASTPQPPTPAPPRGVIRGDEFIPTQELQADEEVTFPVDI